MKKIILIIFLQFSVQFYSQEVIKSSKIRHSETFNFEFSLSADLVDKSDDCITLNIRIYEHLQNKQVNLVANQNVKIGKFKTSKIKKNFSGNCSNSKYKRDYIEASDYFNKYCLKELLRDKTIYSEYKYITQRVIESNN